MTKKRKLILVCLLAALCLSAAVYVAVRGFDGSTAKADSYCVHSYALTGSVEATCMTDAYDVYECAYCGDLTYEYHAGTALGHNWDDEENIIRIEPTCTAMGMDYHVCTRCWNSYQSDPVSPLGHLWADEDGTKFEPTCTEPGYTEYVCLRDGCGYSYKCDETPAIDHSWELIESAEKTCEENGYETYRCLMCDTEKTEYDYAAGHVYTDTVTAPGCISYGYTTHTCGVCGDRYVTDYVSPLGHTYELTEVPASSDSYGYVMLTCRTCGYIYITNIVTSGDDGYTHDYVLRVHAATCFEGGYWEYVCADCGETIICNRTAALIHEWSYEYREPTCTDGGGWVYVCNLCGTTCCEEPIEALGHDYVEAVTGATCTEGGYSTFTCARCGDTYTSNYTAAAGHSYEVRNAVVSTSKKTLTLSYVCAGCGSSAVSRLEVVFTDSYGNSYAFYFDATGTADFSSLPEGSYTAIVTDTYLGKTVSAFTIGNAFSDESDTESGAEAEDETHEHVFTASISISESSKTVTVSYECGCGEDRADEVCVSFRGESSAWTFYTAGGKVDYSSVPAGDYTVCFFFEDEEIGRFALTISDEASETEPGTGANEGVSDGDHADGEDAGEHAEDEDFYEDAEDSGSRDLGADAETDAETDAGADAGAAEEVSGDAGDADDEDGGSSATLVIVLLVVFVVVVGVIVAVWIVWRRRSRKQKVEEGSAEDVSDDADDE